MSEGNMYEVKDNEPIPRFLRARKSKYPFAEMEVGDYFDVPREDVKGSPVSRATSIKSSARRMGIKAQVALVTDSGDYVPPGQHDRHNWIAMRVWRRPNGGAVPSDVDKSAAVG